MEKKMIFNFKNLCSNDVHDVVDGKEKRESCHILCYVKSIYIRPELLGKNEIPGLIIFINSESGPDPKIHFTDLETAEKLYNSLVNDLASYGANLIEIDVLEHGAL